MDTRVVHEAEGGRLVASARVITDYAYEACGFRIHDTIQERHRGDCEDYYVMVHTW